jgi:hypothetical protein
MDKIAVILLLLLFGSQTLIASDSDTTYGKVRIKKRTSSSGTRSSDNDDDDEDLFSSCIGGCMNSCMSSLFEGCMGLIFDHNDNVGVTFSDTEDEETHQPSPPPKKRRKPAGRRKPKKEIERRKTVEQIKKITPEAEILYPPESSNPVHISAGLSAGGEFYSNNVADAFIGGGEVNITFYPLRFLGLRFSAELLGAGGGLNVDLETDVFVNDTFDGTKTFTETSLFKRVIPIKSELLWILPTEDEPFFLAAGGGISYNLEKITGKEVYNGTTSNRTVFFRQWCPVLHFGFGFMIPAGTAFFVPEFRYSLFFNDNMRDYQAPGDVAQYTHMFRIILGLCSP